MTNSNTGKSHALDAVAQCRQNVLAIDSLPASTLRVTIPINPTVRGLAQTMLHAMGDKKYWAGTSAVQTERLQALMRGASARTVVIDEFHNLRSISSHSTAHHITHWLRFLAEYTGAALVTAAPPSRNEELHQSELSDGTNAFRRGRKVRG